MANHQVDLTGQQIGAFQESSGNESHEANDPPDILNISSPQCAEAPRTLKQKKARSASSLRGNVSKTRSHPKSPNSKPQDKLEPSVEKVHDLTADLEEKKLVRHNLDAGKTHQLLREQIVYALLVCFALFNLAVIGLCIPSVPLSDTVLCSLIGASFTNLAAMLLIVVKYFFSGKANRELDGGNQ